MPIVRDELPDVQKSKDTHIHLNIDWVGIKNIKMPFSIAQKVGGLQHTVGDFSLYASLDANQKGTHMSRFIIELQQYLNAIMNRSTLLQLCDTLCSKLESDESKVIVEFDYFLKKKSPITRIGGLVDYKCRFEIDSDNMFEIEVNVPVTSLCPCSKEISKYGAHNQRSTVKIEITIDSNSNQTIWIEDLIEIAEQSASCEVYSVLKRSDEKYVTEQAYNNPAFCEDIVRNIAQQLNQLDLSYYVVESLNHESIHNHIAHAVIES